ncbi:nitrate reductase molybdenum cofactor assembly chaperone [Streptomyces sp. NRRL F-5126]|uniref:nitrate reductase molybdenum cofactor assembly chaperone n=1 Tax=Streptomyces sp. NRRL F-5126 TaxID=1463857 RepID=UPI00055F531B|nr:nitrate reductase molybdenum cofactor assembly chaperone [Streptomyces sp. NRRL F-5126]
MNRAAVLQAASLLLGHPDESWPGLLDSVRGALTPLGAPEAAPLLRFCDAVDGMPALELSARYVATFDRSRRRCLYLTYCTDGDTRRRGTSLAAIKSRYRAEGWQPPDDELPDFLPLLLEFAARCPGPGTALLIEHRAAVEVLRYALGSYLSPYADVLRAVCDCLPGAGPSCHEEALRLARSGPPAESVGAGAQLVALDPFPVRPAGPDPRGARR